MDQPTPQEGVREQPPEEYQYQEISPVEVPHPRYR